MTSVCWEGRFSVGAARVQPSPIRELLKLADQPGAISFAGGMPDADLFPRARLAEAHRQVLEDEARGRRAIQYVASEGDADLRTAIVARMRDAGVPCELDNVVVVNGAQQALSLLGELLLNPSDLVLADRPTYPGALQAFNLRGACYAPIPEGRVWPDAKIAYAMPDFANPTGVTMPLFQRLDVIAAARAAGTLVIEDAAYCGLYYDTPPPPSLAALGAAGGGIDASPVAYCGTFSKTVSPGMRIGWIVAARAIVRQVVLLKQALDLQANSVSQAALAAAMPYLDDAYYEGLRAIYRGRRDAMLDALADRMPPDVSWLRPEGGLFVWLELPERIDADVVLADAIAAEKLSFVPGSACFPDQPRRNTLRLSFSLYPEPVIREGVDRLARAVARACARG